MAARSENLLTLNSDREREFFNTKALRETRLQYSLVRIFYTRNIVGEDGEGKYIMYFSVL